MWWLDLCLLAVQISKGVVIFGQLANKEILLYIDDHRPFYKLNLFKRSRLHDKNPESFDSKLTKRS